MKILMDERIYLNLKREKARKTDEAVLAMA
jgi:hypothetical protein